MSILPALVYMAITSEPSKSFGPFETDVFEDCQNTPLPSCRGDIAEVPFKQVRIFRKNRFLFIRLCLKHKQDYLKIYI